MLPKVKAQALIGRGANLTPYAGGPYAAEEETAVHFGHFLFATTIKSSFNNRRRFFTDLGVSGLRLGITHKGLDGKASKGPRVTLRDMLPPPLGFRQLVPRPDY